MQPILANLREELLVALLPTQEAGEQHAGAVYGEEGADAVELAREDLEHDEREAELRERGAHVGAFERALEGAHFDKLVVGEDHGAGAVHA